jgi:hypothetical protein
LHILAVQKVQKIHQDKKGQEMKVDLAKQTPGQGVMPFWTFGRIDLVENILFKSMALIIRVHLKLDLFLCRLYCRHVGLILERLRVMRGSHGDMCSIGSIGYNPEN